MIILPQSLLDVSTIIVDYGLDIIAVVFQIRPDKRQLERFYVQYSSESISDLGFSGLAQEEDETLLFSFLNFRSESIS